MKNYRSCCFLNLVIGVLFYPVLLCSISKADIGLLAPIPKNTISPNKQYGITVSSGSAADPGAITKRNDIVKLNGKRILGSINAETAFEYMNNLEVLPTWWSSDDSFFLWQVNGPWGMKTQMLVSLKGDQIAWQLNVLTVLQREILSKTEGVDPKKYFEPEKANWENGLAYPETFSIDSQAEIANKSTLIFPVKFNVFLTSNPKGADGIPNVDSSMEAFLSQDGTIMITKFHYGKSQMAPWNEIQNSAH